MIAGHVASSVNYLLKVVVRAKLPSLSGTEIAADLHAHPCITNTRTLLDTLDAMAANCLTLLALTVHGAGNPYERETSGESRK